MPTLADDARILIVKLGAIGDVVYTLPLLDRLRAALPNAYIAWAVEPKAAPIVAGHPQLDRVLIFERRRGAHGLVSLVRAVRTARFDLVLDLQRILKSGLVARLSGARHLVGFDRDRAKELSYLLTNERVPAATDVRHMVEQYLDFARYLGAPERAVSFRFPAAYSAVGPASDVAIGIGAGKAANRWTAAAWARLIEHLSAAGLRVTLTGGGAIDRELAGEIARLTMAPRDDRVGTTTIPETAAVIRGSRLYVGLDSGMTHLACALGHPVIAIYGAADERRTGPWGPRARVVRARPPCAPCGQRLCPLESHVCMTELEPRIVADAVVSALESS